MLCDRLFDEPIHPHTIVSGAWLCDALVVPNMLPQNVTPVLNANLLLGTNAKTLNAWSAEIAATVAHFVNNECKEMVLQLSQTFTFVLPSVYHVNQALNLTKRNTEAENLLISQLLRELSALAQKHDLMLVVVCDKNADAAKDLLEYTEENVGLSRICWCVHEAREAKALLDFSAKLHKNEIIAALPYETVMTERELLEALASWQMRYPTGRLCFVTARDLRQTPFAQMHIENMLKNAKTKI